MFFSAPPYRGPVSDHFDGRRFRNPGENARGFADFVRWVSRRRRGPWEDRFDAPRKPAPALRAEDLRVTLVNHATVLIQTEGVNVLTDPVWSDRVSPVGWVGPRRRRPAGVAFEELPPVDAVLISHNHYDHLDTATLRRLVARDRPLVLGPLGTASLLRAAGLPPCRDLDWWETADLTSGLRMTAVPAQHFSGRGLSDRNRTLWCGFVARSSRGSVYFAGDTGYGTHFAAIAERFPDLRLALLPIGAYLPLWFMGPIHLSPADALRAQADLRAETAVGIHFGTFELADDGQDEPAQEIERLLREARAAAQRFWLLENGEARDVP